MVSLTYEGFFNQLVSDRKWKLYLMKDYFILLPLIFRAQKCFEDVRDLLDKSSQHHTEGVRRETISRKY